MRQEIPRPEHPQPQFQRDDWVNLNGLWEFEFDDHDCGIDEGWPANGRPFSHRILVPYAFESPRSGIGDPGIRPRVWYRRSFTVPPSWSRRTLLHFGAVDYRAKVWINGRRAGEHEGGHTPFHFDITPYLKPGENTLVVRAEDPPDITIPRGKQYWEPESKGIFYSRTTGIWQPVWLESVGESYLDRVRILARTDGAVSFHAVISRPRPNLEFTAVVRYRGQVVASVSSDTQSSAVSASATIAKPRLWSPDAPELYDVVFELRLQGVLLDRVHSYFGFRSVSVNAGRVLLNGEPIFLKFVLDQGYWAESNLTPPSDEAIQYDVQMTKALGFNGVRKHQKVEDPRYLYWADRMGLLVSAEMANAYAFDDQTVSRLSREWIAVLERDFNHPSILIWAPINESWGVPDLSDPRQIAHLRAMYHLTHSLDGTRLVIDNDGWEHSELTDLFAIHDYSKNGDLLYERFRDLGRPGVPVPSFAAPVCAPGCLYNGSPIYLSEFGGIAFNPEGYELPSGSWGYSGIEPTAESALARLRGLYKAIARIPNLAGVCYTQLTDVEQEINGVLLYNRKPKFAVSAIREINDLVG